MKRKNVRCSLVFCLEKAFWSCGLARTAVAAICCLLEINLRSRCAYLIQWQPWESLVFLLSGCLSSSVLFVRLWLLQVGLVAISSWRKPAWRVCVVVGAQRLSHSLLLSEQSRMEWQLDVSLSGLQCKHGAEKPLQIVPEFMAYWKWRRSYAQVFLKEESKLGSCLWVDSTVVLSR